MSGIFLLILAFAATTTSLQFCPPSLSLSRRSLFTKIASLSPILLPSVVAADDAPSAAAADGAPPSTLTPYTRLQAKGGDPWWQFITARSRKIQNLSPEATDEGIWSYTIKINNNPTTLGDYFASNGLPRPKFLLISNMKQDDPSSRTQIPQLLTLSAALPVALVLIPTDQGYFEPDTSALTRLKLKKEYGYGSVDKAIILDKMDWLGAQAAPLLTGYVSKLCPGPIDDTVGVRGNYEKFLVDGSSGLVVRRYARGEEPRLIARDIEALAVGEGGGVIVGKARDGYLEQWRKEIDSYKMDTYRFQKGLNYFDL